jgi:glycosyltransferase involved in cell wall biosynthesis
MNTAQSPKISVLLPVYNAEKYIKQAIDSILKQTFTDFEFIIINDGSTDNSLGVIKSITDKRIIIIDQKNKGLIASLNYGIDISKGELIARMDADDLALPSRFEAQLKLFSENTKLGLCGTSTENFGALSNRKVRSNNDQFLKCHLLFGPPFAHPSIMMKRKTLIDHNIRYDANFIHCEDFAMWSAMEPYCEFSNVLDVLLKYRVHADQVTNQHSSTVLDAHYHICCNNLQTLQIELPRELFLVYIAKQKHEAGINAALAIYISIIKANKIANKFDDEQLTCVISDKIIDQLKNFYGISGFLYILMNHSYLLKKSPFFNTSQLCIQRTFINIYKKLFK